MESKSLAVVSGTSTPSASASRHATSCAAVMGDLDELRRLHEDLRVPWDAWTCSNAVSHGNLMCLVYARENGAPWHDEDPNIVCMNAAGNGHLECLK